MSSVLLPTGPVSSSSVQVMPEKKSWLKRVGEPLAILAVVGASVYAEPVKALYFFAGVGTYALIRMGTDKLKEKVESGDIEILTKKAEKVDEELDAAKLDKHVSVVAAQDIKTAELTEARKKAQAELDKAKKKVAAIDSELRSEPSKLVDLPVDHPLAAKSLAPSPIMPKKPDPIVLPSPVTKTDSPPAVAAVRPVFSGVSLRMPAMSASPHVELFEPKPVKLQAMNRKPAVFTYEQRPATAKPIEAARVRSEPVTDAQKAAVAVIKARLKARLPL